MGSESAGGRLVLVIDDDDAGHGSVRQMLRTLGFEAVRATSSLAGLELIQRLPGSFQFVLLDVTLPGIPGAVVFATLRLFMPELPVLCLGEGKAVGVLAAPADCLAKPIQLEELRAQVAAALAGGASTWEPMPDPQGDAAVTRARARYAEGKSLVEAALELARSYQGE